MTSAIAQVDTNVRQSQIDLTDSTGRYADAERCCVRWLCRLSPLIGLAALLLINRYLVSFLFLKPVPDRWTLVESFQSKPAVLAAIVVTAIPWLWLASLKFERFFKASRIPWSVVLTLLMVVGSGVILQHSRGRWFFVEWVKVRTPNPSFARNTLFWEQRNYESTGPAGGGTRIGLIGSSQTYQGYNLELLNDQRPKMTFEKNTLAGFGPLQYPFLWPRIAEREFDIIVCQLSEFDFFREDSVPVNRLRWASSRDGVETVTYSLTPDQQWVNRGELADLAFAAAVPLWRQRDHFRRTAFGYWWNRSAPPESDNESTKKLAPAPQLDTAIDYLKKNIGHKELVNANFRAFEQFANILHSHGIRLFVVEGQVHPAARAAYDRDNLQLQTRGRLTDMSESAQFEYFNSEQMPEFEAEDFADAYHLNSAGSQKLSTFLISILPDEN